MTTSRTAHLLGATLLGALALGAVRLASAAAPDPTANDPGALVLVTATARVGVMADEIPRSLRPRAEANLKARPSAFWEALARRQLSATLYRLVFRPFYYPPRLSKGQLPMPPAETWQITVSPVRNLRIDGHTLIGVQYEFQAVLVTDRHSPALADPALGRISGRRFETFVLPADPELVLQRTGYACMNESEFPPNSVDEENALTFYDDTCGVEKPGALSCHLSPPLPTESCVAALKRHVGSVTVRLTFERLAWDPALASRHRVGQVTTAAAADLAAVPDGLLDNRLEYRYITADSCAIAEACVGGPGWRRLLKFTASVKNVGGQPLHIGAVDFSIRGEDTPNQQHHLFEYSACHNHYHFTHYGSFAYGPRPGDKRAFCLQTTQRYFNNETTALTSPYFACTVQGISPGWGDDYTAGLECQWIDVTDVDTSAGPVRQPLSFAANPDQFLCEGQPILDALGNPTYVSTPFTTAEGEPVDRFACAFTPRWDANNFAALPVTLPRDGGMVTSPCARSQLGPRRDCGFARQPLIPTCTAGQPVRLECAVPPPAPMQVVRICETSAVLGTGVACTSRNALANAVAAGNGTKVELAFTCPKPRDAREPGGQYSIYTAAVLDGEAPATPTCTPR